jgi:hypothetical protein
VSSVLLASKNPFHDEMHDDCAIMMQQVGEGVQVVQMRPTHMRD